MRILFRADACPQIGTGHVMRCLALAQALVECGAAVVFLCRRDGLGQLAERITKRGMELVELLPGVSSGVSVASSGLAHEEWLPGGWQQDAQACLKALAGQAPADWLIVDHYALDSGWENAMRVATRHVMAVDDLADRAHDCELLLDQNLVANMQERYAGKVPTSCRMLFGPMHALLRPEFAKVARKRQYRDDGMNPRLLVMFGGADAQNLTLRTVRILVETKWSGRVDVVAGPLYRELAALRETLDSLPDACLHINVNDVVALMCNADLAFGSPAGTSWERCACALPCLAIAQADNQEVIGRELHAYGAHVYLGRAETLSDETLAREIMALASAPERLAEMALRAAELCDGDGSLRVASILEEFV